MHFGRYEVTGELGRGGAGQVLRAAGPDGRTVAVKILLKRDERALAQFGRERRLLEQLGEEQGFVAVLDSGDSPQGPFLVMPFMSGGTLRDRMKDEGLGPAETIAIMRQVAMAVGRAHALGIVHRDLKPENVLFNEAGRPLVADLGIAKHFRPDEASIALSKTGDWKGTAGYMAPEQMGAAKSVGPEADVFALGVMLYECIAGRPPFEGDSIHAVLHKVSSGSFAALRAARPGTPRWLSRLVARCLAIDPAARPRTGAELVRALDEGPAAERRRRLAIASFVGLSGLLATGALAVARSFTPEVSRLTTETPGPPRGAEPVRPREPPVAPRHGEPDWFVALPAAERPRLPLPRGVVFGDAPSEYKNEVDGSILVFVPAGPATIGGVAGEGPVHEVKLSAYFIGKLEVTNRQFDAFVAAKGHRTYAEGTAGVVGFGADAERRLDPEATWRRPIARDLAVPDHPVVQVCWDDAVAYCSWAGLRLPSEAEWEKAASAERAKPGRRKYPWGDEPPAGSPLRGNFADKAVLGLWPGAPPAFTPIDVPDGFAFLAPVGSFPSGAAPCGALDMAGNAREWVRDHHVFNYYARSPVQDPVCTDPSDYRVNKGGSYAVNVHACRATGRMHNSHLYRSHDIGFRVARGER